MTEKSTATAGTARVWLVSHPTTLARLSEAARKTVVPVDGKFPKGRLHPEAIALHNARNPKAQYVLGATREAQAEAAKAAKAARKAAARKASRKGASIGSRGPLPKAFIVTPKG